MPVIKQMKMRRGRPERFIITLEEGEELVMSPEIVLKFGLSPGNSFSDDEFLKILVLGGISGYPKSFFQGFLKGIGISE